MRKRSLVRNHHDNTKRVGEMLSSVILGGQDGVVNTLGTILGIAAASSDFRIVVAGGLAGGIAEAISMGAVGYTSKMAERDFYLKELERESYEIETLPLEEAHEIRKIYRKKGFEGELLESIVKVLTGDRRVWLTTMMFEQLNLMPVKEGQPLNSAIVIGFSSFVGALIPLIPFLFFYFAKINFEGVINTAIYMSIAICAIALFFVGVIKSRFTIGNWYKSGMQMFIIGIFSALFGYFIGKIFSI